MTLHLTYISKRHRLAVHTSDRLVTYAKSKRAHDEFSNKTVILVAHRGVASIGYTGLAYISNEPTDVWLARTLWEDQLPPYGAMAMSPNRDRRRRDLGGYALLLRDKLAAEARSIRLRHPLGVVMVGFQWPPPPGFPVAALNWWIANSSKDPCAFEITRVPLPRWSWVGGLGAFPPIAVPQAWTNDLEASSSIEEVVGKLAHRLRGIASNEPTVGDDTMSVALQLEKAPHVEGWFKPGVGTAMAGLRDRGFGPLAFTPFVVERRALIQPMILVGDLGLSGGEIEVLFHGPTTGTFDPNAFAGVMPQGRLGPRPGNSARVIAEALDDLRRKASGR